MKSADQFDSVDAKVIKVWHINSSKGVRKLTGMPHFSTNIS
jgi:hypothetical protein